MTLLSRDDGDDDDDDGGGAVSVIVKRDGGGGGKSGVVAESVAKSVDEGEEGDENDERVDEYEELPALALHKQQTVIEVFACITPSPEKETAEAVSGMRFNGVVNVRCLLNKICAHSLFTINSSAAVMNYSKTVHMRNFHNAIESPKGEIRTVPWNWEGGRRGA